MAEGGSKGGALSSGTSASRKKSDVPTNDLEIADATGVLSVGEKVSASQREKNVKRWRNSETGEITIEGETVEQVRARVKKERQEAEPSEFQKSMLSPGPVAEREPVKASEL